MIAELGRGFNAPPFFVFFWLYNFGLEKFKIDIHWGRFMRPLTLLKVSKQDSIPNIWKLSQ